MFQLSINSFQNLHYRVLDSRSTSLLNNFSTRTHQESLPPFSLILKSFTLKQSKFASQLFHQTRNTPRINNPRPPNPQQRLVSLLGRAGGGTLASWNSFGEVYIDDVPHVRVRVAAAARIGHPPLPHPALASPRVRGLGQDPVELVPRGWNQLGQTLLGARNAEAGA